MADHERIRFQPRYPRNLPLAMGFLVLLGLLGPFLVFDPTATIWEKGSGLILFFFLPFVFASLIKEIEFAEDIRIRRHFAPTHIFSCYRREGVLMVLTPSVVHAWCMK